MVEFVGCRENRSPMVHRQDKFSYREVLPVNQDERRRKLSQNFLVDQRAISTMVDALEGDVRTPVLEFAAGSGNITRKLVSGGYSVSAVELDHQLASKLKVDFAGKARVFECDLMAFELPTEAFNIVSNVPFHLSTDLQRRLMMASHWTIAVLLLQWEVARKRAGLQGGTLVTAAWWPWFDFELLARVPAHAFRPVPRVDCGILRIRRRPLPLVDDQVAYQQFVEAVFTGRGRGLGNILQKFLAKGVLDSVGREQSIDFNGLPKDLTPPQWVALFRAFSAFKNTKSGTSNNGRAAPKFTKRTRDYSPR